MRVTRVTNPAVSVRHNTSSYLVVLTGPDAGREIGLPAAGVCVGADAAADIVLNDPSVSGRHCTIRAVDSGFEVQDLASRNGTYVDNIAIDKAIVPPGGVLRLGRSCVQVMPGEEIAPVEPSRSDRFGELVGSSPEMRRVYGMLERASQSDASILFLGESGTGKELAARATHAHSPRRDGPLVVFDCGAASETLIQSDLFGHVKGAFTGAVGDRIGAFGAAHAGTLFLDEIGDLPLELQPKLLRMLEAGEVVPLGSSVARRFDVRVVAATHRDLFHEVAQGRFRGDLYYRLAVVEVQLPPLRARVEDILELVKLFLARGGASVKDVTGPNLDKLCAYQWPGNVRELRNVISRALALSAPGATFADMPIALKPRSKEDAGATFRSDRPFHEAKGELVRRFETEYLQDLLRRSGGNIALAARMAGLERKYVYRMLERVGLRQPAGKPAQ